MSDSGLVPSSVRVSEVWVRAFVRTVSDVLPPFLLPQWIRGRPPKPAALWHRVRSQPAGVTGGRLAIKMFMHFDQIISL